MKRRNPLVVINVILTILLVGFVLYARHQATTPPTRNPIVTGRIIPPRYKIVLKESKLDHKQEDFSDENIQKYFAENIIDAHTYNFLRHLDDLVTDIGPGQDPLEKIRQYLDANLPADQAEKMFDLYSLYLDYQINLQEQLKSQGMPLSPEEALENLADLQAYRRAVFGEENADMIFGASVEAQEYAIRRNMILYDDSLYGAEKEAQLQILDDGMWGDELPSADPATAYTRYQQSLRIYQKDLAEMRTEEERQAFLQQLNIAVYDPVQRQALEEAEQAIAEEKEIREDYYAQEQEILNDLYLTEPERAEKIRELQDDTFGDEADAFRRREAMRTAVEQINSHPAAEDSDQDTP